MESNEGRSARSLAASKRNKDNGLQPTQSQHVLRLNVAVFDAFMAKKGHTSETAMADFLKVGVGTVRRARQGDPIGGAFVSALTKQLPARRNLTYFLLATNVCADRVAAEPVAA